MRQFGTGVAVVELPQELLLGTFITGRAVASDANAQDSRPAPFALRLKHRIQNHFPAAVQVPVCLQFFVWQRILRADVFTPASLEDEPNRDFRRTMLMKMQGR